MDGLRGTILTGEIPAELHMTTPGGGCPRADQKLAGADFIRELPTGEPTLAEVLKQQGYATAHFGKWHLGQADPGKHGFDAHDGLTGNEGADGAGKDNPKDVFGMTARAMEFLEEP